MNNQPDREKFEPMGTKISPAMAVVWSAVCEALHTDTYHLLQQFIYSMIRAASDQHALTPEMRQLLDMLDLDAGWQNAINLCAPNGKLSISQMILIVEQDGKKGFGAVMLDKPFMGQCQQTENVDQIYERITEVIYKSHYRKLRQMGIDLGTHSVRETIDTMIDAQTLFNLDDALREGPQMGDRNDSGRVANGFGKKTKSTQHRTPDGEANRQQKIQFKPDDVPDLPELMEQREQSDACIDYAEKRQKSAESQLHPTAEDMERDMGFKPFTSEW